MVASCVNDVAVTVVCNVDVVLVVVVAVVDVFVGCVMVVVGSIMAGFESDFAVVLGCVVAVVLVVESADEVVEFVCKVCGTIIATWMYRSAIEKIITLYIILQYSDPLSRMIWYYLAIGVYIFIDIIKSLSVIYLHKDMLLWK